MAIQAKYTASAGLNETLNETSGAGAEFHLGGVGVSYGLQTNTNEVVKLTTVADSATLFGSTIKLYAPGAVYSVFFNRAAGGDPEPLAVPEGAVAVDLTNDGGDTATEVATALEAVIEALGGGGAAFASSVAAGNEITITANTMGVTAGTPDMGTSGITSEIVSAGTGSTVLTTTGVTIFSSTADIVAALTLGDLTVAEAGALKTIHRTDGGTANLDVSVANHTAGDPTQLRFDAQNEYACLVWLGSEWSTVSKTAS